VHEQQGAEEDGLEEVEEDFLLVEEVDRLILET
jgi:hypothetical protein